jgi:hypothetical protein
MYGKAGAFRFKKYGVEYRTLSNFWIQSEELMRWAFNKTIEAIELVNSGVITEIDKKFGQQIQTVINNNDKEKASLLSIEVNELIEKLTVKKAN